MATEGDVEVAVTVHAEPTWPPLAALEPRGPGNGGEGLGIEFFYVGMAVHPELVAEGIHVHEVNLARVAQHHHVAGA